MRVQETQDLVRVAYHLAIYAFIVYSYSYLPVNDEILHSIHNEDT